MTLLKQRPALLDLLSKMLAVFALVFGLLTIISGGSVLFGPISARQWAGDFVGFVVWFNFLAGWLYVVAGAGLWLGKSWSVWLAAFIAISTAIVALGFGIVVLGGSAFEMRTVGALAFRFGVWSVIAFVAKRAVLQK